MTLSQKIELLEKHLITVIKKEAAETKSDLKNDILNFKDEIMGEVKDLREEVSVTAGYRPLIADHESRITKLEKHSLAN